jgi:hypothetical protein
MKGQAALEGRDRKTLLADGVLIGGDRGDCALTEPVGLESGRSRKLWGHCAVSQGPL